MFAKLMRDTRGGVDDAFGLIVEVFFFTLVFVFAAVLIGSATAQAMSEVVAHHLAALETSGNQVLMQSEAKTEAHDYLMANVTQVSSSLSGCSNSANACVVTEPCSSTSPACVVVVERRVMIPIVDSPIIWSAKAVSIWPQSA